MARRYDLDTTHSTFSLLVESNLQNGREERHVQCVEGILSLDKYEGETSPTHCVDSSPGVVEEPSSQKKMASSIKPPWDIRSTSSYQISKLRSSLSRLRYNSIHISSKFFVDDEVGMDMGYAWVVDFASFFVQFFIVGTVFSFGVFMPIYVEYFQTNQASVAWAGSISSFLMVALGLVVGGLDDRYGNNYMVLVGAVLTALGYFLASFSTELWHLYVTQGLIVGVGYSAGNVSAVSIVGQWFKKNRALAMGIAVAGAGLGQFTISMVLNSIINSMGWRGALRFLALFNLIGLTICGLIIRRRLPTNHHLVILANSYEFLSNVRIVLLACASLTYLLGMFVPYAFLPLYAEAHGIARSRAVLILSVSGLSNALGRIAIGKMADKFGRIQMLLVSIISSAIITFCWQYCRTFSSLLAFGLIYGFCGGGSISLTPSIAVDILGVKKVSAVVGLMYTVASPGNLLAAPIAGFMYQAYGSYQPMIVLAASFMIVAAAITFILMHIHEKAEPVVEEDPSSSFDEIPQQPQPSLKSAKTFATTQSSLSNQTLSASCSHKAVDGEIPCDEERVSHRLSPATQDTLNQQNNSYNDSKSNNEEADQHKDNRVWKSVSFSTL